MTSRTKLRYRLLLAGSVLKAGCMLAVWPTFCAACPACLGPGVPKLTLVQRLIDSDQIVVAKATTQHPGTMTIETVIQGDLIAGTTIAIPREELPVLNFEESDSFLLGRQALGRRWKLLGPVSGGCDAWLKRMAGLKRTSELTDQDWVERVRLFLPDLEHPDPLVSSTAFGEIARAPYAAMRANREWMDQERLLAAWRSDDLPIERRPLYALLLGICGNDHVDRIIDEQLSMLHRNHDSQGLAAWLVAKLERAGTAGLAAIQRHYLADLHRSEEERLAAFLALSIQGNGNPEQFREPVVAIYRDAIESGSVNILMVSDLAAWSRWEFRSPMRNLIQRSDLAIPLRKAIQSYLLASGE
ncbi:MAG: hypothetical protein ACK553_17985 [Planctomycetota bacterium]|jgi:hypothetical protein